MLIDVTQADIDGGCRGIANNCPVAKAVQRHLKKDKVYVGARTINIYEVLDGVLQEAAPIQSFATPAAVERFIRTFDVGGKVEPFSFELAIPEELCCSQRTT